MHLIPRSWWNGQYYIDQRANSIPGGLGQMIGSFNSPFYMGIDRFQTARETGSLSAWTVRYRP